MARIVLEQVTKVFSGGETVAVDDVSIEIGDGEFMVLVGPSGCGKSTLLRIVAGLEDLTNGEVMIGDRIVTDLAPKDSDIAMVFQNYALYPHMTVRKNLGIGLKLRRTSKQEINTKVVEVAEILGLERLLERKPAQLSGGQRQRVAIGRAMVREPQAFLMDEPLSNLDAKLRVQMRGELARLRDRLHTTTIYVTHDQVEAMTLGDRVAVMRDGVVQQLDTPAALFQRPANQFVAAFIGSPSMNLFEAQIAGREVVFGKHRLPIHADHDLRAHDGKTVILGMRPVRLRGRGGVARRVPPDHGRDRRHGGGARFRGQPDLHAGCQADRVRRRGPGGRRFRRRGVRAAGAHRCDRVHRLRRRPHVRPARQPGPADVRPCPAVLLRSRVRPGDRYRRTRPVRPSPPGRICSRLRGGSGCRCRRPIAGRP